ncbi:MAG: hypothetical protein HOK06_02850 [Rhodospirillaceae bacterium]|jgi:uncharacterized protein YjiS (DUF1127 family)|nr:hypothetical protein [Rhodospirillaceae bacterium]MBT4218696.1 hypothetical protein [Rhodospirillaceae bacterium]MBT4464130.1 hypothetical protein [Rhodospirillaceae bacterium]MBT5308646.1 hypothetical protein [Rhodospirillaceae bacterium]MBT6406516.1 hypothetical protein [Rhodospirillaceae bacterium]
MIKNDCIVSIKSNNGSHRIAQSWVHWLKSGIRLFIEDAKRLADLLIFWQRRATERQRLRDMDSHLLDDIGLQRRDAIREGGKPFWMA